MSLDILSLYDSENEFPISEVELNDNLGYVRKSNTSGGGLRILFERNLHLFDEGIDYIVVHPSNLHHSDAMVSNKRFGAPPPKRVANQTYYFSIDAAKELCLMAGTEKGKEFRRQLIEVGKQYFQMLRLHRAGLNDAQMLIQDITREFPGVKTYVDNLNKNILAPTGLTNPFPLRAWADTKHLSEPDFKSFAMHLARVYRDKQLRKPEMRLLIYKRADGKWNNNRCLHYYHDHLSTIESAYQNWLVSR